MRRMEKITGRTDDMMIVRGVNVFPTQIEELILKVKRLAPHYQIELTREDRLDEMEVLVEAAPAGAAEDARQASAAELGHHVKGLIGVTARITVADPGGVERSQGKAAPRHRQAPQSVTPIRQASQPSRPAVAHHEHSLLRDCLFSHWRGTPRCRSNNHVHQGNDHENNRCKFARLIGTCRSGRLGKRRRLPGQRLDRQRPGRPPDLGLPGRGKVMWASLREELREGLWLASAVGGITVLTVAVAAILVAVGVAQA